MRFAGATKAEVEKSWEAVDCPENLMETHKMFHNPMNRWLMDFISRKKLSALNIKDRKRQKKFILFLLGGLRLPRAPFKSAAAAASASQVRTLKLSRLLSRPVGLEST